MKCRVPRFPIAIAGSFHKHYRRRPSVRGDARSPAQNHLAGHELAVVLTERAWKRLVSRITGIGGRRPFPAIAEELLDTRTSCCSGMEFSGVEQVSVNRCLARDVFPLRLSWKPATTPTRKRLGLEQLTWHTGVSSSAESPCQPVSVNTRQPVLSPASRRQYRGACQAARFTLSQPSESQSSARAYASSDMNSRYSRQVTLRFAIWNGSKTKLWRGVSLSRQKSRGSSAPKWITNLH
jgi:hypothetical protein